MAEVDSEFSTGAEDPPWGEFANCKKTHISILTPSSAHDLANFIEIQALGWEIMGVSTSARVRG